MRRTTTARFGRAIAALTALVAATSLTVTAGAEENAAPTTHRSADDRLPARKPAKSKVGPNDSREFMHLKFVEGSDIRLRGHKLVSEQEGDVPELDAVFAEHGDPRAARMYDLWYRLRVKPRTDLVALLDDLNALDIVELAYAEPLPAAAPN